MLKTLATLLDQLRRQPAAYAVTGLGAVGALLIAFFHLTTVEAATVSGALTAIGTIVTAVYARPVNFTVIAGAATVLLQSLVLFNVHMSSGEVAAVVGVLNFVLGMITVPTVATPTIVLNARMAATTVLTASVGNFDPIDTDELAAKLIAALSVPAPPRIR